MVKEPFQFFLPLDIVKSDDKEEMRIAGYASTPDKDRQDDILIQDGLDISNFVNHGWFNNDHNSDEILGYPDKDKTHVNDKGFYVEGVLLPNVEQARRYWEVATELKRLKAPRRLGFSVEGQTIAKDAEGRIQKAAIYNVAITANPVNPNATWEAVVKSFSTPIDKALDTGGYSQADGVSGRTGGAVLQPESLEQAFKTIAKALGDGDDEELKALKLLEERLSVRKAETINELILYFQLTKGLSRTEAKTLVAEIERNI